ncbi:hypothetical protein O181_051958 [Austropuccinia psidii MF-1]|uniref:Uncharacterized protein n=1 Tax=Austropuccinia psidii MF-1 TaxID=1389203 RepID=A0A9Q3HNW1_9BASI|nr:hypothetical protein [Austropuccinia psidii MF-1]
MKDYFKYGKERWDKSNYSSDFKVGDLVFISTLNFHNIKVPKELKDYFAEPFIIRELHVPNAVQLEITGELMNEDLSQGLLDRNTRVAWNSEIRELTWKTPKE